MKVKDISEVIEEFPEEEEQPAGTENEAEEGERVDIIYEESGVEVE